MLTKETQKEIYNRILRAREGNLGWTTGFPHLDKATGKLRKGQLWVIGGYTGAGKSYVVLNMIEGMLRSKNPPRIGICSTELGEADYAYRHCCLRVGCYPLDMEQHPDKWSDNVRAEAIKYAGIPNLYIKGNVYDFKDIQKAIVKKRCDVVFVDYVQDLVVKGKYDTKEIMPIIAKEMKRLAMENDCCIVLVSQINNSAVRGEGKSVGLLPFSYGKEMNQAAHVAVLLEREFDIDGNIKKTLIIKIVKARDGYCANAKYTIEPGYNLMPWKDENN